MSKTEYYWKKFFGVATEGNRKRQCLMKSNDSGETRIAEIWQSYQDPAWKGSVDFEFITRNTATEAREAVEEMVRKTGTDRIQMKVNPVRWSDD
jgi:hypothetical protein